MRRRGGRVSALVLVVLATGATVAGATTITVATGLLATASKTLTHATCVVNPATVDTYVDETAKTTSFSTNSTLSTVSTALARRRVLIQFSLAGCGSTIDNASVDAATLSLFVTTATGGTRTLTVYRATASWASTVTWNTQPAVAGTATTSFTAGALTTGLKSIDVTGDLNDVLQSTPTARPPYSSSVANFGWMIADENTSLTGVVTMTSSEGTASQRPKLTIDYAY